MYHRNCPYCGIDVGSIREDGYMLTVRVWQTIRGEGTPCIRCVETRLGRDLTPNDFSHAPINRIPGSVLLESRRAGKVFLDEHQLPAAAMRMAFVERLQIDVQIETVATSRKELREQRVTFRRVGASVSLPMFAGWSASTTLARLDTLARSHRNVADLTRRQQRFIRRRAGRAEAAMRLLLTPDERDEWRYLCMLPSGDGDLPIGCETYVAYKIRRDALWEQLRKARLDKDLLI